MEYKTKMKAKVDEEKWEKNVGAKIVSKIKILRLKMFKIVNKSPFS